VINLLCMWHDKIEAWMPEQTGIAFEAKPAKSQGKTVIAD